MDLLRRAGEKKEPFLTMLERPFYIINVLWGEQFRDYFLQFCLPSFLSPGNLPALRTRQKSRFLLATRPEDWAAMKETAIFKELERWVEPVYIEIPPCPPDKSGCEHMGIGHKLACELAFRDKAYGVLITPDCMISDGTIRNLQDHALAGIELVLVAALRFGEEPLFRHFEAIEAIPNRDRIHTGEPLAISGRQMAYAAVNGMHSETMSYEWEKYYSSGVCPAAWWKVPGEDGIVLHSLSWAPLLLDYGAIEAHDTSVLDHWTIDGDYVHKNFRDPERVHVVQDSDEMFFVSWAPLDDKEVALVPVSPINIKAVAEAMKMVQFGRSFHSEVFDSLKRSIFFNPVRLHAKEINSKWASVERRAEKKLKIALNADQSLRVRVVLKVFHATVNFFLVMREIWICRSAATHRFRQMLRGEPGVSRWVFWRVRCMLRQAIGLEPRGTAPPCPPV